MEYLEKFIKFIFDLMRIKFDLFGYDLSFFAIFVFSCLAAIIAMAIGGIFDD